MSRKSPFDKRGLMASRGNPWQPLPGRALVTFPAPAFALGPRSLPQQRESTHTMLDTDGALPLSSRYPCTALKESLLPKHRPNR